MIAEQLHIVVVGQLREAELLNELLFRADSVQQDIETESLIQIVRYE
jgi:hypothetical protein